MVGVRAWRRSLTLVSLTTSQMIEDPCPFTLGCAPYWRRLLPPQDEPCVLLRNLYQAVAEGEHQCLQLRMHPQLGQDARHVIALGSDAYVEALGDPGAVEAPGELLQDLHLAGGEALYGPAGLVRFVLLGPGEAEQLDDLLQGHQRLARPEPFHGPDDLV